MRRYEPSAETSPTETTLSSGSYSLNDAHPTSPRPFQAQPPPSEVDGYYNQRSHAQRIEAELYHKLAVEASATAAPKAGGPSWAQRRVPASILAGCATLLSLLDVLCCSTSGLSQVLYAYSWSVPRDDGANKSIRVGVFARVVNEQVQTIMDGSWGGSSSASYLQTWFFCQLFLLILTMVASVGVAFAPHPPEDVVLTRYRHLIRACILLLIALTGVPWSLLAMLAGSQADPQIGYFVVVGQSVLVGGSCFGLFLSLRLERDEDWLIAHEDAMAQKREAKIKDKQRRADFKKRKAAAIALAKQNRAHDRIMGQALGREGARALLINQMMSSKLQGNSTGTSGSQAGFSRAFSGSAGMPWTYPPQPPPSYQPFYPNYGGYH